VEVVLYQALLLSFGARGLDTEGAGCRVQGAAYRVQGTGCRVQGTGYWVQVRGAGPLLGDDAHFERPQTPDGGRASQAARV